MGWVGMKSFERARTFVMGSEAAVIVPCTCACACACPCEMAIRSKFDAGSIRAVGPGS